MAKTDETQGVVQTTETRIAEMQDGARPPHVYGKVFCEEGVIAQAKFPTEEEAAAYALGARHAIEAIDPDNDFYYAETDDSPAIDFEELPEGPTRGESEQT